MSPRRSIRFWVNDELHEPDDVDPRTLLLDYLRSDAVGLTGTKKVCAQGGCGACTVTLSTWNERDDTVEQTAINSCLRPLCAVDGMAVTTVEGLGSVSTEISPVQHRIAIDNGSQCGYCTPGWVMNMHSFLVANDGRPTTQAEIEELFDGNLCRCTGYRPILDAMKHFATECSDGDSQCAMTCLPIPGDEPKVSSTEPNRIPDGIRQRPSSLRIEKDGNAWIRVVSMDELREVLREWDGPADGLKMIVGNTSIGIYGEPAQGVTIGPPNVRVDISAIQDLHEFSVGDDGFTVGAATSYSDFIDLLDDLKSQAPPFRLGGLDAVRYMARRTAGRIVRDAASLGGNTMLVVRHVDGDPELPPFPSDMFTALCALGATVDIMNESWSEEHRIPMLEFAERWRTDEALQRSCVLLRYHVPFTRKREWARTFKVALREVNSHSIVNAGFRVLFDAHGKVTEAHAVFGGIGPIAFHATELQQALFGQPWNDATLTEALARVRCDVATRIEESADRMRSIPDEGFTDEYRTHLAESFVYQFFVWVADSLDSTAVAPSVRSVGARSARPVSRGRQTFTSDDNEFPVSYPFVKVGAFLQASGGARYTHDTPGTAGGVEAALVVSIRALTSFAWRIPDRADRGTVSASELADELRERFDGFVDLVTAQDVRDLHGTNDQAPSGSGYPSDPLICDGRTTACGQVLAIVLAEEHQLAIDIAWWVQRYCVDYTDMLDEHGHPQRPVIGLHESIEARTFLHEQDFNIASVERLGSDLDWVRADEALIDGVDCRVVRGAQMSHTPQIHFYMETQSAIATPGEDGQMSVLCSTQNPNTIHQAVAGALAVPSNKVDVRITRVGGGYGGKGPRSPWAAANAAIAARKIGRSVRLAVSRETDSATFGHESPLFGEYHMAIGTGRDGEGLDDPHDRGRLMGMQADLYVDAGNTADCTPVVLDCVQLRFDNGYFIPNYRTAGKVCLTNTISNTSFRSLDAISGITILEDGLEAAAHEIGVLPEDVRTKNLYRLGDFTPYGEVLDYCYLDDVWEYTRTYADFERRLEQVHDFNRRNRWVKKGISMIPVKYGMGFNLASMERGDALVEIYDDGSVIVRHGGAEIGQGISTQITQLVARELNIPMHLVRIGTTSTAVIPNPESTGASTGTAFNGGAARHAAQILRKRLEEFCLDQLRSEGRSATAAAHIDFWDHDEGWQAPVDADPRHLVWNEVVTAAAKARVDLSVQAKHDETGGTRLDTGLLSESGNDPGAQNFVGYTYSAACSEVEVNILTGEVTVLRSDLVYDMGRSINPATDIGQVEGAFVQGIGRVLLEDVVWQSSGPHRGLNNTPNTWGYKIPATTTVPLELNVDLYPRAQSGEVPDNPNLLLSSKEVGEPPLCLATTVYFAIKHAILDSRTERGIPGWFRLDMPCTVQRVRETCLVDAADMSLVADDVDPPLRYDRLTGHSARR